MGSAGLATSVRGAALREAAEDDASWRLLNTLRSDGVTWADTRRIMLDAQEAYQTNPIAYAAVEAHANLVVSGGLMVSTADADAAAVLDAWWTGDASGMRERVYRMATEIALYGETFVRTFVNAATGECVMRTLDPVQVEDIRLDPDDPETALEYGYRPLSVNGSPTELVWIPSASVDHWFVNATGGAMRGRSDLAVVLPWLVRYKEWLVDRVRLNKLKASFVYEVTINGARRDDLEALRREYEAYPPEPGSILFHGEHESWKAVQPHVASDAVQSDGRALRLIVATGVLMPEHILLAEGGNANRATAQEMNLTIAKRTRRRQDLMRRIVERLAARVLVAAQGAGRLAAGPVPRVTVTFREPIEEHRQSTRAQNVQSATAAVAQAASLGWLTAEEAGRMWRGLAGVARPDEAHEGATG